MDNMEIDRFSGRQGGGKSKMPAIQISKVMESGKRKNRRRMKASMLTMMTVSSVAMNCLAAESAVKPEEMKSKDEWVSLKFAVPSAENIQESFPFSFKYGEQGSGQVLSAWPVKQSARELDKDRTERTLIWTDPKSGLEIRCVAVDYRDFPTIEWTVYFKNTGKEDSPILEKIQALDAGFRRGATGEFALHRNCGDTCIYGDDPVMRNAFQPLNPERLYAKKTKRMMAESGLPSNKEAWPYFNITWPGEGLIVVVGWPGQWAAEFTRDETNGLHIVAGQELTHLKLHPGEEIRTPLMVLQFWKGDDRIRSQNIWRRWMLAHNVPRPSSKQLQPQLNGNGGDVMVKENEASQKARIDGYLAKDIKPDYWWMDAGWYPVSTNTWSNLTGTWEVDTNRFPRGLRAISDHSHSKGIKTILWFEPENVHRGIWSREHPEWILGGTNGGILNLGNSETWDWLVNHIDKRLTEEGVDIYRQDFNNSPLGAWRGNDAKDRQGITEIKYVIGYLAFWDELLRRHPDLRIDGCAAGGRRDDLETLRRAVPLWRCDYAFEPVGQQCQTYGLAAWIPFYGTAIGGFTAYQFRSCMTPAPILSYDTRPDAKGDFTLVAKLCAQWREIAGYYLGDYYPLTSFSMEDDAWMAWQFDCPEKGGGIVQVFRRANSPIESARFQLKGLVPGVRYTVRNLDVEGAVEMTGSELMEKGLPVTIFNRPHAVIFRYDLKK